MFRSSVILPVFNGAETLERALQSIFEQTTAIQEIVIINDGSTDSTGKIITKWEKRLPIVSFTNVVNIGLTESLQLGVAESSGDLLFRLDADDIWFPNHVEMIMRLRMRYPDAVLYATRALIYKIPPIGVSKESPSLDDSTVRAKLLWDNPLVHSAIAFDRVAYEAVGGYVGPTYAEDYDLWIRILNKGHFAGTNEITVGYYVMENSVSRISRQRALKIRLGLQIQAIRTFAMRHPLEVITVLPIVLLRRVLNWMNLL